MNTQFPIVLDEAQFAEAIHKKLTRERVVPIISPMSPGLSWESVFLARLPCRIARAARGPGPGAFHWNEKLINEVFLDASVAGEQIGDENLRKQFFFVEHPYHLCSFNPQQGHRCNGRRGIVMRCG